MTIAIYWEVKHQITSTLQVPNDPRRVLQVSSAQHVRGRASGKEDEVAGTRDLGDTGVSEREQGLYLGTVVRSVVDPGLKKTAYLYY